MVLSTFWVTYFSRSLHYLQYLRIPGCARSSLRLWLACSTFVYHKRLHSPSFFMKTFGCFIEYRITPFLVCIPSCATWVILEPSHPSARSKGWRGGRNRDDGMLSASSASCGAYLEPKSHRKLTVVPFGLGILRDEKLLQGPFIPFSMRKTQRGQNV